jgi:hypothetical protein
MRRLDMKCRLGVQISVVLLGLCGAVGSAAAGPYLFMPMSGAAFNENRSDSPGTSALRHRDGVIVNTSPSEWLTVEASLGHTTGGTYSVRIFGEGNGLPITCSVVTRPTDHDQVVAAPGSTSASGPFNFLINVTYYGESWVSIKCLLPPSNQGNPAGIKGAVPSTTAKAFVPVSAAAFRPHDNSPALPSHLAGYLLNESTTAPAVVEASLGYYPGITSGYTIYGRSNGPSARVTCDITAVSDSGYERLTFHGESTMVGNFVMEIPTYTASVPNKSYFHTLTCTLPPKSPNASFIYGALPYSSYVNLFTPVTGAAAVPAAYPVNGNFTIQDGAVFGGGQAFEVSLGQAGSGMTFNIWLNNGAASTSQCWVYARRATTGAVDVVGSGSTSVGGFQNLQVATTVPGAGNYFFTMRCTSTGAASFLGVFPAY